MQKKKVHRRKHLILYIPENINLDELLKQNPPKFKCDKDCFTYILSLIVSIPSRLKDFDIEGNDGFIPINKKILQKRIRDYRPYIDYLLKHGVVEESKHYIPGEKSGGLRYAPKYEAKIKSVKISKWTLIKSIISLTKETDKEAEQKLDYLKRWFNDKIRIDMDGVLDYLYSEYEKDKLNPEIKHANARFNVRYMTAFKIKNRQFNFTVDNTSGRLHTPLTQLKKELRKYITYDGKKLCNVDITNSQPYLATSLLEPELYKQNKIENRLIHYTMTTTHQHIQNYQYLIKDITLLW